MFLTLCDDEFIDFTDRHPYRTAKGGYAILGREWGMETAVASRGFVGGVCYVAALLLVVLATTMASTKLAWAHDPSDNNYRFSCANGGPAPGEGDGVCWVHHTNADARWRFDGSVPSNVRTYVRNAVQQWDQTNGHQFNYVEVGPSTTGMSVFWLGQNPCGNPNFAGCAYATWTNFHINEAVSNVQLDSRLNWNISANPPSPSQLDLWGLAVHETGHLVGLGHAATATASMNPAMPWGSGGTQWRSLHADDTFGRCQVYGHEHDYWGGC